MNFRNNKGDELNIQAHIVDETTVLYIWITQEDGTKAQIKFTGQFAEMVAANIYEEIKKCL